MQIPPVSAKLIAGFSSGATLLRSRGPSWGKSFEARYVNYQRSAISNLSERDCGKWNKYDWKGGIYDLALIRTSPYIRSLSGTPIAQDGDWHPKRIGAQAAQSYAKMIAGAARVPSTTGKYLAHGNHRSFHYVCGKRRKRRPGTDKLRHGRDHQSGSSPWGFGKVPNRTAAGVGNRQF
jgi:hypothetical protein